MRIIRLMSILWLLMFFLLASGPVQGASAPVQIAEKEPNSAGENAQEISFPGTISGTSVKTNDVDYYKIVVPGGGLESLYGVLKVEGNHDIDVSLEKENGEELTTSNFFGAGKDEYLTTLNLAPGTYLIKVTGNVPDETPVSTYTLTLSAIPEVTEEEVGKALNKALDFLLTKQEKDGAFSEAFKAGMTGLALQAFMNFEGSNRNDWPTIYKGLDYLKTQFRDPEAISDPQEKLEVGGGIFEEGKEQAYEHAIALTALIEAHQLGIDDGLSRIIPHAVDYTLRSQVTKERDPKLDGPIAEGNSNHGGWRYSSAALDADLSVSGWQIIALVSARKINQNIPQNRLDWALKYVRNCWDEESKMFCYMAEGSENSVGRCGMGALSMHLLGAGQDEKVAIATRHMLTKAPTWEGEPGGMWPFYYWYYGTRAAYFAGGDTWKIWKKNVQSILVRHQNPDGSWELNCQEVPEGNDIYITALGALMLEICQGSLPLYLRKDKPPQRPPPPPHTLNEIKVRIKSPRGETISGSREIVVDAVAPKDSPLTELTISVDGVEVFTGSEPPFKVEFDFGEEIKPHVILAKGVNSKKKEATDQVNFKGLEPLEVDFTCTVVDDKNNYILDLQKESFQVSENDTQQTIVRFSRDVKPVTMILILDTSGSMKKAIGEVQKAACQFVSQIKGEEQVMIMEFADKVKITQDFTTDIPSLEKAIKSGKAKGGTALYDSVFIGADRLKEKRSRTAIIVLTDGKDEDDKGTKAGSKHTYEEALAKAKEAGVNVYTLGLGKNLSKDVLEGLAKESGGRSYFAPTPGDLAKIYEMILKDLRSVYTIGYSSTNPVRDKEWRTIEVTIPEKEYTVRAKKGYFAQ